MFANTNRQLLHENSSVKISNVQSDIKYLESLDHLLPELELIMELSLSTSLGWTATCFPLCAVVPSQRSANAVDSRYATRSTSSSIVHTAASYSNLEHGLDLLAGSPVCFSESVRFSAFCTPNCTRGHSTLE